jgi:hypothetical protein
MKGNYSLTINLSRNFSGYRPEQKNTRVARNGLVMRQALDRTHDIKERKAA